MKVKATNAYKELKLKAVELGRVPEEGEIFEIKNEKFSYLNGNNKYKKVFVEKVEEKQKELILESKEEKIILEPRDNKELDEILKEDNKKGKNK